MKITNDQGFFTNALHGLKYREVAQFGSESQWADPALRFFFEHATVDTNFQNPNYLKEVSSKILSITILLLFAPIMLLIVCAIKLTMPGKVFYKQVRVGRDGKLFEILKFRSMIENAETTTGHTLSWSGDPRVTPFGNFLRKSHLDELPQLINVLKGDMYFIGPRPERPEFTSIYDQEIADYSKRHEVKPGITGLAQICCLYDATAEQKLKYDLMYIAFRDSIALNLLIGFHTAKKMISMSTTAKVLKEA